MENISLQEKDIVQFLQRAQEKVAKNPISRDPLFLNFVFKKIPHKRQIIRFQLPHDLQPSTICVFTKDVHGKDYEKTCDHYNDLSKSEKVKQNVTFIPLRELTVCYMEYEAKRRLSATYDLFLADQRIVHRLPNKLGKAFYSKKKFYPFPVDLESDLSKEVSRATSSTQLVIQAKGSSESCIVGFEDMNSNQLCNNIICALKFIPSKWPGGLENIRSISIECKKSSLPVFYSTSEYSGPKLPRAKQVTDTFKADMKAVLKDLPSIAAANINKGQKKPKTKRALKKPSKPELIHNKSNKNKVVKKKNRSVSSRT